MFISDAGAVNLAVGVIEQAVIMRKEKRGP